MLERLAVVVTAGERDSAPRDAGVGQGDRAGRHELPGEDERARRRHDGQRVEEAHLGWVHEREVDDDESVARRLQPARRDSSVAQLEQPCVWQHRLRELGGMLSR